MGIGGLVVRHRAGGIITTIVTILIAVEELSSVYGHRLENGGSRILVLEVAFSAIRGLQRMVLGKVAQKTAAWAGDDAGDAFAGTMQALRKMDDASYAANHEGAPAPARRHTDVAVDELPSPAAGAPAAKSPL